MQFQRQKDLCNIIDEGNSNFHFSIKAPNPAENIYQSETLFCFVFCQIQRFYFNRYHGYREMLVEGEIPKPEELYYEKELIKINKQTNK